MTAAVWVLDITQVVIFQPFSSGVIAVVNGDMAVEQEGSGHKKGGLEV